MSSPSDDAAGCGCLIFIIAVVAIIGGYLLWDENKSSILEGAATLIENVKEECKDPTWVKEKGEWVKHCRETPLKTKVDPFLYPDTQSTSN